MKSVEATPYKGYSKETLAKAFDVVCVADDWRAPIDKTVYADASGNVIGTGVFEPITLDEVKAAIEFFTATEASCVKVGTVDAVKVTAVGYRAGPAGS